MDREESIRKVCEKLSKLVNYCSDDRYPSSSFGSMDIAEKVDKLDVCIYLKGTKCLHSGEIPFSDFVEQYKGELNGEGIHTHPIADETSEDKMELGKLLSDYRGEDILFIWGSGGEPDPLSGGTQSVLEKSERLGKGVRNSVPRWVALDYLFFALCEPIRQTRKVADNLRMPGISIYVFSENWTRKLQEALDRFGEDEEWIPKVNYLCHNHFKIQDSTLEIELGRLTCRDAIAEFAKRIKDVNVVITYGYSLKRYDPKPVLSVIIPHYLDYSEKKKFHIITRGGDGGAYLRKLTRNFDVDDRDDFDERVEEIALEDAG